MTIEGQPEAVHRLVAFINTRHCPDGDDVLADERAPAWLTSWLGRDDAALHVGPDALLALRDLREGMRELAAANNGQQPDTGVIEGAATVLASAPVILRLGDNQRGPHLVAEADADPARHAAAAVAQSYLTVRASGDWARVKSCAAADCRWVYFDTSRNRSRRWCDMTNCGNRAKNRTWRERVRAGEHAD
ncbi:CGNR zinc finger domain-containing protein [Nocardia sp. NPDC006044]|uniref:CGNR zinc finger domain-containing protein n=1 Tax=Nocardia sp. NPDC006044 TaxID=3364306 RepID=UPI0036AD2C46